MWLLNCKVGSDFFLFLIINICLRISFVPYLMNGIWENLWGKLSIFLTLLWIFLFLIFFFIKKHFQKCMSKCLRALESCTTPEIIDVQTSYPLHCKKMTNDFFTYLSRYTNDMMRICKDIILYLTYFAVVIMVSILLVCVCVCKVTCRSGFLFFCYKYNIVPSNILVQRLKNNNRL